MSDAVADAFRHWRIGGGNAHQRRIRRRRLSRALQLLEQLLEQQRRAWRPPEIGTPEDHRRAWLGLRERAMDTSSSKVIL